MNTRGKRPWEAKPDSFAIRLPSSCPTSNNNGRDTCSSKASSKFFTGASVQIVASCKECLNHSIRFFWTETVRSFALRLLLTLCNKVTVAWQHGRNNVKKQRELQRLGT